jgi:hypothetical protein
MFFENLSRILVQNWLLKAVSMVGKHSCPDHAARATDTEVRPRWPDLGISESESLKSEWTSRLLPTTVVHKRTKT